MTINDIFDVFKEELSQLSLIQSSIKLNAKKEFEQLLEFEKIVKKKSLDDVFKKSIHNMTFINAYTGKIQVYRHIASSIDNRKLFIQLHKNKQYVWLLAEAYEKFEDYIERIYAYCGKLDINNWPLKDYGNITHKELIEKPFDWYLSQARNKKNIPSSIISRLKTIYPNIASLEITNKLEINLNLAINLIECLRHEIVHNNGIVGDREKFINEVLKRSGLINNKNPKKEYVEFIENYFGVGEYERQIALLEIRIHEEIPLDIHVNLLGHLFGYLMTYAHIIYSEIRIAECGN